nr:MAG TPA: hypothetical protein [Caudoviricetes sp.]
MYSVFYFILIFYTTSIILLYYSKTKVISIKSILCIVKIHNISYNLCNITFCRTISSLYKSI